MRKLTKEKLTILILALTLILISVFCTTYSATKGAKTFTGTITFNQGGTVEWLKSAPNDKISLKDGNTTMELTLVDFDINTNPNRAILKDTSLSNLQVNFSNNSVDKMYYKITVKFTPETATDMQYHNTANNFETQKTLEANTTAKITIAQIINKSYFENKEPTNGLKAFKGEIIITAEFQYEQFN